jgi:hypothetical protein
LAELQLTEIHNILNSGASATNDPPKDIELPMFSSKYNAYAGSLQASEASNGTSLQASEASNGTSLQSLSAAEGKLLLDAESAKGLLDENDDRAHDIDE